MPLTEDTGTVCTVLNAAPADAAWLRGEPFGQGPDRDGGNYLN